MYYPNNIEDICYEQNHIDEVVTEIRKNIPAYFDMFIQTEGGTSISHDKLTKLATKFGSTLKSKKKPKNRKLVLQRLIEEAENDFDSDRDAYQEHLDTEALDEYGEDVNSFKNTILKNQIPIIRKTLQNKSAKELDKYRRAFAIAQAGDLFEVVNNIVTLAEEWKKEWYNFEEFENISSCEDMGYFDLDEEKYTAYGVIGGGIRSHLIYKLYPKMYPNRSRKAVWALWYLTDKKKFGCKEDSEFLMINVKESTTQQNYFYPYALFSFYALEIYRFLKKLILGQSVNISEKQRFIVVNRFLSFVSRQHQSEIDVLKQSSKDYYYEY